MPHFLVERYLTKGGTAGLVRSLRRALVGTDVVWLGSIVLADEDACLCLFEARSMADVIAANHRAGADLDRIVEALLVRSE